jgi:hypothetical protein
MTCKAISYDLLLTVHLGVQTVELRPVGIMPDTDNPDARSQRLPPRNRDSMLTIAIS